MPYFLLLFAALQTAIAADATKPVERTEMAKILVAQMAAGEFDKAVEPFDATMKTALPADKLKKSWDDTVAQYGPLVKAVETRSEKVQQYDVVYVTCEFQRGTIETKAVFSSDDKIAGLFFQSAKYKLPGYVDPAKFENREEIVGRGIFRLPGTLSLPKGDGPFPAVVLVHGSGPQDRDESIGAQKPFRDLAEGLASRGVAVLRYEKRTKEHNLMMALAENNLTVKQETIDDAALAFDLMVAEKRIDGKRIVLLGHSLGGTLVPRIAKAQSGYAGFICMAGLVRPLEDAVWEQTEYIMSLDGPITEDKQAQLDELQRQVAKVKSPDLSKDTPKSELPLDVPAKYWLDLRGYDPAKEAQAVDRPMLFLQGERDYQVTMEDFDAWKKALAGRKDVEFILYPKLNHLFMTGEGKSKPAEYTAPGNVDKQVVEDIAKWVQGLRGATVK
jgi:uncharacterized protein